MTGIDFGVPSLFCVARPWEEDERQFVTAEDWREQRSDSMTAPFKLEPKVTHLYAVYIPSTVTHISRSLLSLYTHRQHKGERTHFLLLDAVPLFFFNLKESSS
jgi:hypothetical protein